MRSNGQLVRLMTALTVSLAAFIGEGCTSIQRDCPTNCTITDIAPSAQTREALAPTGALRVALIFDNPSSGLLESLTGERKGVAFDLGKELARRMEIPFEPIIYRSLGALLDAAKPGDWDVAFIGVDPTRASYIDFTSPYLEIELGYLVPRGSSIGMLMDVDRPGTRVAVPQNAQADLILSRTLKHAELFRVSNLAGALEAMRSGKADAYATNKASLFDMSDQLPGSRLLDGRFGSVMQSIAIPKGRNFGGLAYLDKFVEDAKSKGLVKMSMDKAGVRGAVVPMKD